MDVWSPAQYLRFAAERRLPFDALVALCERREGGQGVDLGCGTGERALHPVRVALPDDAAYAAFLASYEARSRRTLGPPAMPYLFTFKRIFLWARFDEPAAPR